MTPGQVAASGLPATFRGYERGGRLPGVRDRVLVLPSVICSHVVADRIADRFEGAVSASHDHGCGQLGSDRAQTERTLVGLGSNPNIGGVLVVGLGCETSQSDALADRIEDSNIPVDEVTIQNEGGTEECYQEGRSRIEALKSDADRQPVPLSDVAVGIVSQDFRPATLDRVDPLLGSLVREVVDVGGRALVAAGERIDTHTAALQKRCRSETAEERLASVTTARSTGRKQTKPPRKRAASASPSEITRAWSDKPIETVLEYGERASFLSGVGLINAPPSFEGAATALAAAGAQVIVHAAQDGNPAGHPIVPILKITSLEQTYRALTDAIDVYADAATGAELQERVGDVLDGKRVRAEEHGLTNFAISRAGPST